MCRRVQPGKTLGDLQSLGSSDSWRVLFSDWWRETTWSDGCDAAIRSRHMLNPQISVGILRLLHPRYVWRVERIHWASPTVRSNTNQLFLLAKSGPTEKCRFARIGLKILWRLWTKTKVLGPKTKRHQNLNTLMTKCNADHNIYPSTTRAPREKKIIKKKSLLTIFSTTMWHISHFLSKDCNFKNCRKRKHEKRKIHIIFRQCNYPLIMTLVS